MVGDPLEWVNRYLCRHRYLSPDRVVVLAGIFFWPAFLVSLVRPPAARSAACFDFAALRPAPPLIFLRLGLPGF
jgi:hypothetical protein